MVQAGVYNKLKVVKRVDFGLYLTDGNEEILLPLRFMPKDAEVGDELEVFIYHDNENRLIATTQHPKAVVGDIVLLHAVSTTPQGAFLDWGLMKDVFVPLSQQVSRMAAGNDYIVMLYIDERTGRVAATEKFERLIDNTHLTVHELEPVSMLLYRQTDIGYMVIINNKHWGVLHYNDVFRETERGEKVKGFIKHIRPDNKIDVAMGEKGYQKVADEEQKILSLLHDNNGYLPYHDKSLPDDIYSFFGMSKKTFKMTIGALYKKKKITFEQSGIKLNEE